MKWNEFKCKPHEGQHIVVREKDANGRYRYAIGVWGYDRFCQPYSACDVCGGKVNFMPKSSLLVNHKTIAAWIDLNEFIGIDSRLQQSEKRIEELYLRASRCEEIMYDFAKSGDDSELVKHVEEGISRI